MNKNKKGFIAFTSLLIISAITLVVSISIATLGVSSARGSLDFKKGKETYEIAKSCAEESLIRLRNNATYTGGNLTVGDGSCTIAVSGTGSNKTIDVVSIISNPAPSFTKKIRVITKRTGNSINVLSFTEVE